MELTSTTAEMLLLKCNGDEIWDVNRCQREGVPNLWIEELVENYESGYDSDRNTVYFEEKMVNQFRGVLDLHLAYKLAEYLGIDWKRATAFALTRQAEVAAIIAELDEI